MNKEKAADVAASDMIPPDFSYKIATSSSTPKIFTAEAS